MRKTLLVGLLYLLLLSAGCKQRILDYPYAENNTTTTSYFGNAISDEYQWLEMSPVRNQKVAGWLKAQSDLSHKFI
ncbi:MAG: hypothetical protein ACRCX1_07325, partial [Bacteroidales bacterium]